jgi:hypothetical protein
MEPVTIKQIEVLMGGSGNPAAFPRLAVALAGQIASARSEIERLKSERAALGNDEPAAIIAAEKRIEAETRALERGEGLFADLQKWANGNAGETFERIEIERETQRLAANDGERRELEQRLRRIAEEELALSNRVIAFNLALARDQAAGMRAGEKPIPPMAERPQPWPAIVSRWPA